MIWRLRAMLLHICSVLRMGRTDREVEEELRFHLEMRIKENLDAGMPPEEAEKAALRRFGGFNRVKEMSREIRRGSTMESLIQDLRYSFRALIKQPKFIFAVVITMAFGIGANTAVFSVVDSVLLKPLPYERPTELTLIWSNFQKMGASRAPASGVELREIRDRSRLLQGLAGIWVGNGTFAGDPEPEQIKLGSVTPDFFSVLGAKPGLGRDFISDGKGVGPNEVILSYGLWNRRFGTNPDVIGRAVRINGSSFTVVGVMPSDFLLAFPPDSNVPMDIQAWTPFQYDIYSGPRDLYYIRLLGRLKSGVTVEQSQTEAESIAEQLRHEYAEYGGENLQLNVVQLHSDVVKDIKPALLALFFGAGLVLLICCFNTANLLLTRANARRKEIALRAALGASGWRIARQLLFESLMTSFLAGALGLGIGWAGLKLLMSIRPESLSRIGTSRLDLTIIVFAGALTLISGLLASIAPVLEISKANLIELLKEEGRNSSGRIQNRTRNILIVSEIALGFVLLVGAGLMARTLIELRKVSPGFNASHALTFEISPPGGQSAQRTDFVNQFEEGLSALSGVQSVGAVSHLPLDDYPNWYSPYAPEGIAEDQKANLLADYRAVTSGYFQAIGGRLTAGRYFDKFDNAASRNVVIVDEMLARQTWPNESALGKKLDIEQFTDNGFENRRAEVIGVVEHIKGHSLLKPLRGQIYIPYPQSSREHLSFVVRTGGDPLALVASIRSELKKLDKNRAIAKVRPMEEYVERAMSPTNFTAVLAGIFAALALLLAAVGIYGVISYSVGQRTHEIGVRMALGAKSSDILRMIMKEGLMLTAVGLILGFIASLAASRYLQNMLFGVAPTDPGTYIVMAAAVPLVTLLACWRPARKAASGNPIDALRN